LKSIESKHRQRIVEYKYHQKSGFCSIGSGAVESAIKQIDLRLKLVGAQWKAAIAFLGLMKYNK
jgi:hypothetical protein